MEDEDPKKWLQVNPDDKLGMKGQTNNASFVR